MSRKTYDTFIGYPRRDSLKVTRNKYPPPIVPTLRRGNADSDAPASRNAGALPDEFPRWSVGTRLITGGVFCVLP